MKYFRPLSPTKPLISHTFIIDSAVKISMLGSLPSLFELQAVKTIGAHVAVDGLLSVEEFLGETDNEILPLVNLILVLRFSWLGSLSYLLFLGAFRMLGVLARRGVFVGPPVRATQFMDVGIGPRWFDLAEMGLAINVFPIAFEPDPAHRTVVVVSWVELEVLGKNTPYRLFRWTLVGLYFLQELFSLIIEETRWNPRYSSLG